MYRSGCPITNILDLIGDKWSLIIIRDMFMGRKTFKEFLHSPEGIASNILTSRLKDLKSSGFINFIQSPSNKKVKFYYLENKGIDLYPILYEMSMWSERNLNKPFHPLSQKWFIDTKGNLSTQVIRDSQQSYKKIRAKILEQTTTRI